MGNRVDTTDSFSFAPELNYLFPVTVNYGNGNASDAGQCQSWELLTKGLAWLSIKVRGKI